MEWTSCQFMKGYSLVIGARCYPVIVAGAPTDSVSVRLTQIKSLLQLVRIQQRSGLSYQHADSSIVISWCKQHAPKQLVYMRVSPDKLHELLSKSNVYDKFIRHCQPHIKAMCDSPQYAEYELAHLFEVAHTAFPSETGMCVFWQLSFSQSHNIFSQKCILQQCLLLHPLLSSVSLIEE